PGQDEWAQECGGALADAEQGDGEPGGGGAGGGGEDDGAADGDEEDEEGEAGGGDSFGEEAEHDAGGDLGGADEAGGDGGVEVGPAVVREVRDEVDDRCAHRADRQREGDGEAEHRRVTNRNARWRGR